MLDGGVALGLASKLALLEVDVGGHVGVGVALADFEGGVVEGMPAGEGDELERIAHSAEFALELGDGAVVEVGLPVERR